MLTDEENGVRENGKEILPSLLYQDCTKRYMYNKRKVEPTEKGKDTFGPFCVISKARKKGI
jgi:hypothetical protein